MPYAKTVSRVRAAAPARRVAPPRPSAATRPPPRKHAGSEGAPPGLWLEPAPAPNVKVREVAPDYDNWDPVHGASGYQVSGGSADDEDPDGRSDSERLVESGIARAELDLRLEAFDGDGGYR